jgi:fructose-1,6-bisphosphatase/inositol monophosphatase family enzyme
MKKRKPIPFLDRANITRMRLFGCKHLKYAYLSTQHLEYLFYGNIRTSSTNSFNIFIEPI